MINANDPPNIAEWSIREQLAIAAFDLGKIKLGTVHQIFDFDEGVDKIT